MSTKNTSLLKSKRGRFAMGGTTVAILLTLVMYFLDVPLQWATALDSLMAVAVVAVVLGYSLEDIARVVWDKGDDVLMLFLKFGPEKAAGMTLDLIIGAIIDAVDIPPEKQAEADIATEKLKQLANDFVTTVKALATLANLKG